MPGRLRALSARVNALSRLLKRLRRTLTLAQRAPAPGRDPMTRPTRAMSRPTGSDHTALNSHVPILGFFPGFRPSRAQLWSASRAMPFHTSPHTGHPPGCSLPQLTTAPCRGEPRHTRAPSAPSSACHQRPRIPSIRARAAAACRSSGSQLASLRAQWPVSHLVSAVSARGHSPS